jgi:hypothetical protein
MDKLQVGHKFHVKVILYPERDEMSRSPMQCSEINYLLNPQTGTGLSVQLIGYSGSCLLTLYHLPFVEVYTPRVDGESSYVQCGLTKSKKDGIHASFLARELFETKGDALAYVGVLIDYYRTCNSGLQTTISAHSNHHHLHVMDQMDDGNGGLIERLNVPIDGRCTTFSKIIAFAETTANSPRACAKSPSASRNLPKHGRS